jgi:hypothetical protein
VGDSTNQRDNIQVTMQDGVGGATLAQYVIPFLAAGAFDTTVTVVTPTGGTLGVQIADLGGANIFWVVNGLDIWTTTDPGVQPQLAASKPGAGAGVAAALTPAALAPVALAAEAHWLATGLSPAQAALLTQTRFEITPLAGGTLGLTGLGVPLVQLDVGAAGRGWFIDPTPAEDSEFAVHINGLDEQALPGSPAYGHYDLLTVVEHELGHVLGLDDLDPTQFPAELMTATIGTGERRLPGVLPLSTGGPTVVSGVNVSIIDQVFSGPAPLPVSHGVAGSVDLSAALAAESALTAPAPASRFASGRGSQAGVAAQPVGTGPTGAEPQQKQKRTGALRALRRKLRPSGEVEQYFRGPEESGV